MSFFDWFLLPFSGQPNMSTVFDIMNHVETAAYGTQPMSFLCNIRLRQQNLRFYVKACMMEVSSEFYETTTPKAPLDVKVKLINIGNSTFTTASELSCGGKLKPLIRLRNVNNIVHKKTQKPELLPDWWVKKFLPFVQSTSKQKLIIEPVMKPDNTHRMDFTVPLSDTDHNEKTRCSSYMKYFLNNTSVASRTEKLLHIKSSFHEFHIKRMSMLYTGASQWGDTLSSEIWQSDKPLTLYCQVSRDGTPLWFGQMDLHEQVFGLPSLEVTQDPNTRD